MLTEPDWADLRKPRQKIFEKSKHHLSLSDLAQRLLMIIRPHTLLGQPQRDVNTHIWGWSTAIQTIIALHCDLPALENTVKPLN